jgi:hypothetical protein
MTTLLTIQHDPNGKLLEPLREVLPLLNDIFAECCLVITPETDYDVDWPLWALPQAGMANARRDVINLGLVHVKDDYYFYCDLDRLIFWASQFPDELRETVRQIEGKEYTVIGRKYMAMQSHPIFQFQTEEIMSKIVKEKAGLDMDVFAGARGFSYQVAKRISEQSEANHAAQDIEWPMIVKENGGIIRYIEVEGLAYESAMLDIRHSREDEFNLRMTNLKSVLEFLSG